jgi:predicted HNH restriction endonuclease
MKVPRSEDMQLVGYVLARCGIRHEDGRPAGPPPWLGTATWRETYDLFLDAIGDGRTADSFANSLKNTRDAFDAHVPSGRVGWLSPDNDGPKEEVMVGRILAKWGSKSDEELREAVELILAQSAGDQSDEPEEATVRTEGGMKLRTVRQYERHSGSRDDAIAIHGTECMGCGFDFGKTYGTLGRGYIEVHHAMPLADYGIRETDPEKDLTVLCANCHRMVHRRKGICLSVDELRARIATAGR